MCPEVIGHRMSESEPSMYLQENEVENAINVQYKKRSDQNKSSGPGYWVRSNEDW